MESLIRQHGLANVQSTDGGTRLGRGRLQTMSRVTTPYSAVDMQARAHSGFPEKTTVPERRADLMVHPERMARGADVFRRRRNPITASPPPTSTIVLGSGTGENWAIMSL